MTSEKQRARKYAILRSENPEAMDILYNAGYAANYDYMTFAEAAAITSYDLINTGIFRGKATLTHLEEAVYFSGATDFYVGAGPYASCTSLTALSFAPEFTGGSNGGIWWGCTSKPSILFFSETPPALSSGVFNNYLFENYSSGIYVYDNLISAYQTAWPQVASMVHGFSEYTGKIIYPEHYNFSA